MHFSYLILSYVYKGKIKFCFPFTRVLHTNNNLVCKFQDILNIFLYILLIGGGQKSPTPLTLEIYLKPILFT